jgi:hypothetical protein
MVNKINFDLQLFATVGTGVMTAQDIKSMVGPDGLMLNIVETLFIENQILEDVVWKEGNLPTGNLTGVRTSIPRPGIRILNQGGNRSKSSYKQITDTCCILEDNSEVDEEVLELAANKEAVRASDIVGHAEGFRESVADMFFYGSTDANDGEFNGLDVRYNKTSATKTDPGYQIVLDTGAANVNTSAWIIDWGDRNVVGIYPKGTQAGLQTRDVGRTRIEDNLGNPLYAWCTNMKWKVGLAVENYRKVVRMANIDTTPATLNANTTLLKRLVTAKNRLYLPSNPIMYVNNDLYTWLEIQLTDVGNQYVTQYTVMGKTPQLYFKGIPVRKCDSILSTEATLV